jgi:hypothetical protein
MNHSFLPNDNLLLGIIRRMDLDCDARLNMHEFTEAMNPIEPFMRQKRRPKSAVKTSITNCSQYKYLPSTSNQNRSKVTENLSAVRLA